MTTPPKLLAATALVAVTALVVATMRRASAPRTPGAVTAAEPDGGPRTGGLPAGHPPIGNMPGQVPGHGAANVAMASKPEATISWTVPARWQAVPHMSAMRIATYWIPKVAGDIEDPELSVVRAGGHADANATRWIGQFDEPSRGKARKSSKTVAGFRVTIVEIEGEYAGMGDQEPDPGWALLGAIVETEGQSHFFKLTGPEKSVRAARAEFDALVASIRAK